MAVELICEAGQNSLDSLCVLSSTTFRGFESYIARESWNNLTRNNLKFKNSQSPPIFPAPAPHPVTYTSTLKRSRDDTSLSFLTRRFAELLSRSADGVLDLNVVSQELSAPKRRVYDVTNVLEGIQLIKKKSKNNIQWL